MNNQNSHEIKYFLLSWYILLDIASDHNDLPRYVTKMWIEVYDQSGKDYSVNKETRIKTLNA